MHPELHDFLSKNGFAVVVSIATVACLALIQWSKTRRAELLVSSPLGHALLETLTCYLDRPHDLPSTPRKGFIEQVGQLHGFSQALLAMSVGLSPIVCTLMVCVTGCCMTHQTTHRVLMEQQRSTYYAAASMTPPAPIVGVASHGATLSSPHDPHENPTWPSAPLTPQEFCLIQHETWDISARQECENVDHASPRSTRTRRHFE